MFVESTIGKYSKRSPTPNTIVSRVCCIFSMSSRLDAEDIATSFYPYFNFTRAFFALLRQDISWGACRKNTQNVVCSCLSSYDKIGQFTKNPGQGQKKFRLCSGGRYTGRLLIPSTSEYMLIHHHPPKPSLAKRGVVTPSFLEGVGVYSTACAATRLIHMHTTSFLMRGIVPSRLNCCQAFSENSDVLI